MALSRTIVCLCILSLLGHQASARAQATQQETSRGVTILHSEARLVRVDVTALNAQGSPVKGLAAGDFQVLDDGHPQKILSMDEHHASDNPALQPSPANILRANEVLTASTGIGNPSSIWNVVLVDLLNTPKDDLPRVSKQLTSFLNALPPEEPVALMTMSPKLKTLVPFEAGASAAAKYITSRGFDMPGAAAPAGVRSSDEEALNTHMIDPKDENFKQIQKAQSENYTRSEIALKGDRVQQSFAAFSTMANTLQPYVGRKIVYYLSAGFPLQADVLGVTASDQLHPTGAPNQGAKAFDTLQQNTLDRLEKARVSVYPVDATGVQVADIAGETSAGTEGLSSSRRQAQPISIEKADQVETLRHLELLQIARQTGGVAHFSNDLKSALTEVNQQGQQYYTIFYKPSGTDSTATYHSIQVLAKNKQLKLIFRPGYFTKQPHLDDADAKQQFRLALTHSAPAGTGLQFNIKVSRASETGSLEYSIQPQGIAFKAGPDGQPVSDLDCAILEFDGRGVVTQTSLIQVTTPAGADDPTIHAKQLIALRPGATSISVGVRDRVGGAYGTLNISLAAPTAPAGPSLTKRSELDPALPNSQVRINVVVKSKDGVPVPGLEMKDFAVWEDRTADTISAIETAGPTAPVTTQPVQVLLFLDAVNATFGEYNYARDQTIRLLRQNGGHLQHPTCVLIWSKDGLRAQLKPTQDGNLLARQIESVNVTAPTTLLAADPHELEDFQSSLQTLEAVAANEHKIAGRKLLIWIGPGWPLLTGPAYNASVHDKERDFAAIVDLSTALREAQIALYNVSLKRLERVGFRSQSSSMMRDMSAAEAPGAGRSSPMISSQTESGDYKSFLKPVKSFHDADSGDLSLQVLAIQSGGRVMNPGNDIAAQIEASEKDADGFYTLSFSPKKSKRPNEFHELRVQVDHPSTAVQATNGFYGQP